MFVRPGSPDPAAGPRTSASEEPASEPAPSRPDQDPPDDEVTPPTA
jgi:hypothetical protein